MVVDGTEAALVRMLDAVALRHRVLVGNLANADTPDYVRKDVEFEQQLADALRTGNLEGFSPTVTEDRSLPPRGDGNNVALDHEMSEISKNALMHQMTVQLLQTKFSMQRLAITGRQ